MNLTTNFAAIRQRFPDPDPAYRTAPLWVWNDLMAEDVIERQLAELKQHGFGGAFVHPRPGLVTEYLSGEWFDRWSYALETAKRLAMKLYIYDENSYPSGFAGGHVPAMLPDCLAASAACRLERIAPPGDPLSPPSPSEARPLLKAYAVTLTDSGSQDVERIVCDLTDLPPSEWHRYGDWCMRIEKAAPQMMTWLGGFAYVDLMRPEVTEAFLQTTYEAYRAKYGEDFGSHIPAIFTDEPAVTGSNIYAALKDQLPFSHWFAAEFRKRRGYSLIDHLPALFKNVSCDWFVKDAEKVRYDYYCTIRELWVENSIRPIADWCGKHGIAWTGHFMEHCWPLAGGMMVSPSIMSAYEYFQWPAIDLLLGSPLKDKPVDDMMLIMLEVQSVANQLGKQRVVCETYGAGGWDSTFEDYKRMADWLFAHGINFINQHYTLTTTAGARKRDHPQSFDWRQPWWDDYADLNDYCARASYVLAQGRMTQRILVLHPTTTGYLVPKELEDADLMAGRPPLNPDMRGYLSLLQTLTTGGWDYDLGDEWILGRHAAVVEDRVAVGQQSYSLIIVSGDMRNMVSSTLSLLQRFMEAGGTVIAIGGHPGPYVDGESCPQRYEQLIAHARYRLLNSDHAINGELERRIGNRIRSSAAWAPGVAHMRREWEDRRTVYFFVNHSQRVFESFIELPGRRAERWDLWTGKQVSEPVEASALGIGYRLRLNPNESLFLVVEDADGQSLVPISPALAQKRANARATIEAREWRIEPEDANVHVIDYCDLLVDDTAYLDVHAPYAGQLLFRHRGFEDNPWDNAIQYRRRVLDRDNFGEGSGFTIAYHFHIDGELPDEPLDLVAERAGDYELQVNGHPVAWTPGAGWLDHHNGAANIRPYLRQGRNTATLTAKRFHVLLEVEPVYLRGSFAVRAAEGTWALGPVQPVGWGSWVPQGYPFYPGAFLYRCKVEVPASTRAVWAELPIEIESTACTLYIDGQRIGLIGLDDGGIRDVTAFMSPGSHEVALRVCGGYKNMLGPHHDPARERRSAWPGMWKKAPKSGRPAAEQYDLIAYGANSAMRFYSDE